MFKKLKSLYYKWKTRGYSANEEVYIVVDRPNELGDLLRIKGIYKSFKLAKKHLERITTQEGDRGYRIERYGLWSN